MEANLFHRSGLKHYSTIRLLTLSVKFVGISRRTSKLEHLPWTGFIRCIWNTLFPFKALFAKQILLFWSLHFLSAFFHKISSNVSRNMLKIQTERYFHLIMSKWPISTARRFFTVFGTLRKTWRQRKETLSPARTKTVFCLFFCKFERFIRFDTWGTAPLQRLCQNMVRTWYLYWIKNVRTFSRAYFFALIRRCWYLLILFRFAVLLRTALVAGRSRRARETLLARGRGDLHRLPRPSGLDRDYRWAGRGPGGNPGQRVQLPLLDRIVWGKWGHLALEWRPTLWSGHADGNLGGPRLSRHAQLCGNERPERPMDPAELPHDMGMGVWSAEGILPRWWRDSAALFAHHH